MNVVDQNTSSWKTERKYGSVQEFFVERPDLSPLALVALLRLPLWEKPWRARTGSVRGSLKPLAVARGVVDFEGSWATAGSWDELGLQRYSPFPRDWEARKAGDTPGAPGWWSDPCALDWRSTGIAHHSWNWKIRICQCVIWINEDEMCCINTSGAWSCLYPLGYSGSQGEKVDLYL